jgi:hypothetical protein
MARIKIEQVVSDLSGEPIDGNAVELTARFANGQTQRVDLSEAEYKGLGLEGKGQVQKRRGRRPKSAA